MLIEPPFDDWPRALATVRQREMVSAGDEDEILGLTSQFPHPDGLFSRRDGVIGAMDEQDRAGADQMDHLFGLEVEHALRGVRRHFHLPLFGKMWAEFGRETAGTQVTNGQHARSLWLAKKNTN